MPIRKKLFIVGAANFGRELESAIEITPADALLWNIQGYLHTNSGKSPLEGYPSDYNILGSWEDYPLTKDDHCLIAVTQADWKLKIYRHLKAKTNIVTYVNATARIGKFNQIGEGSIVAAYSVLSANVKLGILVFVNGGTQVGHDTVIGDYTTLFARVQVGGGCIIGENVTIGSCAVLIPGIKIGDGATVGTGSVVIRDVKPGVTVFGNPAKTV